MKKYTTILFVAIAILIHTPENCLSMTFLDKLIFSNKKVADKIEMEFFLLTNNDLSEYFLKTSQSPHQPTFESMFGQDTYILIRMRSNSNASIWGTLSIKMALPGETSTEVHRKIDIYHIPRKEWGSWVVHFLNDFRMRKSVDRPSFEFKWEEIYSK